jgi:hypothetical protein
MFTAHKRVKDLFNLINIINSENLNKKKKF